MFFTKQETKQAEYFVNCDMFEISIDLISANLLKQNIPADAFSTCLCHIGMKYSSGPSSNTGSGTRAAHNSIVIVISDREYAIQYIAILQINNTIYCNALMQRYNVLQYFRSAIQYIVILQMNNTIYCNTSEQQ